MDKNVYSHQPTDADRGLDRRTPPTPPRDGPPERLPPAELQREGGCQRARWDLDRVLAEIGELEWQEQSEAHWLEREQNEPLPRRCTVIGPDRRARDVDCRAEREQDLAGRRTRLARIREALRVLRARLPELRAAVARECREPEVGRREPPGRGAQK
ncbi:MAG TPA: hypothetical protein VF103_15265 [Polyangiaceae bacterium]